MHALLIADDPSVSRLAHMLTALHWIAAALAILLLIVAAMALSIYRRNKRADLTGGRDDLR